MRISYCSSGVFSSDLVGDDRGRSAGEPPALRAVPYIQGQIGVAGRAEDRHVVRGHRTESGPGLNALRSEERRVGKECGRTCRSRWSTYHEKNYSDTQYTKHI